MNDKELKLENYIKANQSAKKGQIVFAGSSLMEMFPINELLKEHNDPTIIYNRGIGGYISEELLAHVDALVTDLAPRKVFINIGTNDLSRADFPISALMENYDKILTEIEGKVPGVQIYLMAYYPINYEAAEEYMKPCLKVRTNEKINEANKAVEKLAEAHKQRYIDVNRNLRDGQGRLKAEYTIEGMHIKKEGYAAIYEDVMRYVKE
ncbi:MAG: GDSL-type esterase/lipase family protein [Agathobacter sp.]|nr:GDSL-type esterase/lipase family protein [Agathobacter sp.]